MTEKEQLWYLIDGLIANSYDIDIFCDEFVRIYNLEVDYTELSEQEKIQFKELCVMAARFSADEEELKIPQMYFSKNEIISKAMDIQETIQRTL